MAKTTLSFSISPVGNNWQPRRHFVPGTQPQILALPQEIMDMIVSYLTEEHGFIFHSQRNGWWPLRLVSHTFDLGLSAYFAKEISQNRNKVYFDLDEGAIDDICRLAESRYAPSVKNLALCGKDISPHIFTLTDMEVSNPAQKTADLERWARWETIREKSARKGRKLLIVQMPPRPLWSQPTACVHDDIFTARADTDGEGRGYRQRDNFGASFPGWTATWEPYSWKRATRLDLRPSEESLHRLSSALMQFTNIQRIETNVRTRVHGQAIDSTGNTVATTSFGECSDCDLSHLYSRCPCYEVRDSKHQCSAVPKHIVWPAAVEIGLLSALLPSDLPLFTTLTHLEMDLDGAGWLPAAKELVEQNIAHIASFIGRCRELKNFHLIAATDEVLHHMAISGVHFAKLEKLLLHGVGAFNLRPSVLTWLTAHIATLAELDVRNKFSLTDSGDLSIHIPAWSAFLEAILTAQEPMRVSARYSRPRIFPAVHFDFYRGDSDAGSQQVEIDNYFQEMAARFIEWDGLIKNLWVCCYKRC